MVSTNQQISNDLSRCWICHQLFGQDVHRHTHHIIPQAYGGVDGPVVDVCDSHHASLHKIALRLIGSKPYFDLLTRDPKIDQRLLWLASRVQVAEAATRNDPNKRTLFPVVLDTATAHMLKCGAAFYKVGRERYIALLIAKEHARLFPKK